MSAPHRIAVVALLVTGGVGAIVACGETHPGASGGTGAPPPTGSCSTPSEGCACPAAGITAPCGVEVSGEDSFLWCATGTRSCTAGAWSACATDGHVSVSTRSVAASGLHGLGYGVRTDCVDADGGTLNPCDPYCQVQSDDPIGFDAGSSFSLKDGGFIVAGCGDGTLGAIEECDDGNNASGDGCSSNCILEQGFKCPTPGSPCTTTTCADGIQEGAEECDDGNKWPYDGCSATCQREATCPGGGECTAVCGDGLVFPTEACDDGNLRNGDGCSSTCTVESDATCAVVTSALPATLVVPVMYRDFTPATNPDFEAYCCGLTPGIVKPTLAADGRPAFNATQGFVTNMASFDQWYHFSAASRPIASTLTLVKQPDDSYVFDSGNNFFPINGLGFGNYGFTGKNYHFTSEIHYPFTFSGGEKLDFIGDDDVFVFINGKLAVDLGGVHGAAPGSVTLNPANATAFGLVAGHTYSISVFQAERRTVGSNYKLTLRGFVRAKSVCSVPGSQTLVRDYEASCPVGSGPVWQLFRWKAAVPATTSIDFRAATAITQAGLPNAPDPSPVTVAIGTATPANSPAAGPIFWVNDTVLDPGPPIAVKPVPVSKDLKNVGLKSQEFLRVFMTFHPQGAISPRLDEWQQLYDCVPNE